MFFGQAFIRVIMSIRSFSRIERFNFGRFILRNMKLMLYFVLLRTAFGVHQVNQEFEDISLFSALSYLSTYTTMFGHNFQKLPPRNHVLVWKLNRLKQLDPPRIYDPESGNQIHFESNMTYLIAATKGYSTLLVYYWLGSTSSLEDRKIIAEYAVELVFIVQDLDRSVQYYTVLSREFQGYISQSLQITLDMSRGLRVPENIVDYIHYNLPLKRKNLYFVKGNDFVARIKKVPVHPRYIRDTSCLVLEIQDYMHLLYPVSVHCGKLATGKTIEVAVNLELYVRKEYGEQHKRELLYIEESDAKLNAFQSALMDDSSSSFDYPEIDNSVNFLLGPEEFIVLHDDAVKVYEINADTHQQSEMLEMNRPMTYDDLEDEYGNEAQKSFLLNSASIAGILVLVYCSANKDQALNAVHIVEDMVWTIPELVPVRVMTDSLINVDFMINLGFPFNEEDDSA